MDLAETKNISISTCEFPIAMNLVLEKITTDSLIDFTEVMRLTISIKKDMALVSQLPRGLWRDIMVISK